MSILLWLPTVYSLVYIPLSTIAASQSCNTDSLNVAQNVYPKRRLTSRVIDSQPISEPIDCYVMCMKNCDCLSYNVCNGGKICELNSERKTNNSFFYETSDECDYHEIIFNNKQSKGCKDTCCFASQPCLNGGRCQATCMENSFRFQCDCAEGYVGDRCENEVSPRTADLPRSCSFYAKIPKRTHGVHQIYTPDNKPYKVYCYFGYYYTQNLAMSYSLENKGHFEGQPLTNDFPVSEDSPNFQMYRLSLAHMAALRNEATKWKIACSQNTQGMKNRDGMKVKIKDLDPLSAQGVKCPVVEAVTVNGKGCEYCMVALSQGKNAWHMMYHHVDYCPSEVVQVIPKKSCSFGLHSYFGNYDSRCIDEDHSCTSSAQATTQFWFITYP